MASFFRRITENWKLKTLAVALAVLLWVVVSSEQIVSRWLTVPFEVELTDASYQLLPPDLQEVDVRISGPARDLIDVAIRRPPLRLTIGNVGSESAAYELSPRMLQLPGQVSINVLDVRPSAVQLRFAQVDSRMIPIRIRTSNGLGRDWELVDTLMADPNVIQIRGNPQRVAARTEIFTEVVEVVPEDTVFERVVALDTTGFQGLQISTDSVRVTGVLDRVVERGLPQVPVAVGQGVRVEPDRVYVLLRGLNRVVQGVSPASFRVVVAIDEIPAEIPEDGAAVPLRIDGLPSRIQWSLDPAEVRLFPSPGAPDTASAAELPSPDETEAEGPAGP